jgi:hypothetical protein
MRTKYTPVFGFSARETVCGLSLGFASLMVETGWQAHAENGGGFQSVECLGTFGDGGSKSGLLPPHGCYFSAEFVGTGLTSGGVAVVGESHAALLPAIRSSTLRSEYRTTRALIRTARMCPRAAKDRTV